MGQRIDHPSNVAVLPSVLPTVAPGYFADDTGTGANGTIPTADWCNGIQEEIYGVVEAGGLVLDKADNTQLLQVVKGVLATASDAADTGVVSTVNNRAVFASTTSRASGAISACVATSGSVVTAPTSVIAASDKCEAIGLDLNAVLTSHGSAVSGLGSVLVASHHAELHDNNTIAGGYSVAAAGAFGAANQNLTWKIASQSGTLYLAGSAAIGCDPDTGTGEKILLNGALGTITADSYLSTGATLKVPASGGAADTAGTITWTGALPPGANSLQLIWTTACGANTLVYVVLTSWSGDGTPFTGARASITDVTNLPGGGGFSVNVVNTGTTDNITSYTLRWFLIEPN